MGEDTYGGAFKCRPFFEDWAWVCQANNDTQTTTKKLFYFSSGGGWYRVPRSRSIVFSTQSSLTKDYRLSVKIDTGFLSPLLFFLPYQMYNNIVIFQKIVSGETESDQSQLSDCCCCVSRVSRNAFGVDLFDRSENVQSCVREKGQLKTFSWFW